MFISKYNRSISISSLVLILLSILVVELSLDLNEGYIQNIIMAINDRGAIRTDKWGWILRDPHEYSIIRIACNHSS
jgi:hypothetical protein